LLGEYHRWLLLNVDHVVPQGEARRLGIPAEFYEDAINLVLACSGCNGYLNRYRCQAEPTNGWSVESFADFRDSIFRDRDRLIATRRAKELTAFDALSGRVALDVQVTTAPPARSMEHPGVTTFVDDDLGYAEWLDRNPDGWVVNAHRPPNPRYLILHRAGCHTIHGQPTRGSQWTSKYVKICSTSLTSLRDWAQQAIGGDLTPCGRCRPLKDSYR
jgi:hypothetical protein